jgi:hypothetical protein
LAPNSRGNAFHCPPLRAIQISPSKMGRSSWRGRPGFLRGFSTTSAGWSSAHSASSTRQIVGSSRVTVGAAVPASFLLMEGCYHNATLSG